MGERVELADYKVEIDGESYSVLGKPDPNSALVQQGKARVLKGISLDKLLRNLSSASRYLDLAYNGTAGTMVQSKVSDLSKGLMNLTNDSLVAIVSFENRCEKILKDLISTFDWLLKGKETTALMVLSRAGEGANKLSREAADLSKRYFEISEDTQKVVSLSIDEKTLSEQKRAEIKAKKAEIEAEDIKAKALIDGLIESRARLEDLYKEAKEKAERAEDKAFAAAIIGAIFGAVGQAVGAFAGVYAGAKTGGPVVPPKPPVKEDTSAVVPEPEQKPKPEPVARAANEAAVGEASSEEVEGSGDARGSDESGGQETVDGGTTEKAEPSKTTGQATDKTQDQKDKEKAAAAATAAAAFNDVGRTTEKMGGSFEAVAVQYQQEKLKYFDLIQQSLAKERESLADIAKFAKLLSSTETQVLALDQAVAGLHQAIGALKRIASILADASLFWKSMAAHCERLAENDLKTVIEDYTFAYSDVDERVAAYLTADFKETTVRYLASWKTLEVICREYREETEKIKYEIQEAYESNPTTEEALKRAVTLGKDVLNETDMETAQLARDEAMIAEAKAATQAELDKLKKAS